MQGDKDRRKFIHGGLSFDQKILMGKKLSFDTTEFLEEQVKRQFRQHNKKVSIDSTTSPDDGEIRNKSLEFGTSPNLEEKRCVIKNIDSKPCGAFVYKQNNISANIMTDVCENSLISEENEEKNAEDECKTNIPLKSDANIYETSNSCKYDKISVDKTNKLVQGDTADAKPEEKPSPIGNRSFLSRLKQFTDRLGLSIDKESNSKFMKHMKFHSLSFKNNNGRMTLPLRYRKKQEDSPCCKSSDIDEEKKASTLPKTSRFSFGGKKSWRQRFLGRDRTSNSLDNIPPSSPISVKASTSHSETNSRTCSPRKEEPRPATAEEHIGALEPDPQVLGTSIELM